MTTAEGTRVEPPSGPGTEMEPSVPDIDPSAPEAGPSSEPPSPLPTCGEAAEELHAASAHTQSAGSQGALVAIFICLQE